MANIAIKSLKPQVGTLRVKHPVLKDSVFDETLQEYIDKPIELFDLPDGTKGPLEIYFVGMNSKQWFDFIKKMKSDNVELDPKTLFSRISSQSHELVASLITGWLDNGALDTPYSPEEALSLVSNPENGWILEQIYPFILDQTHFFLRG